MTLPAGILGAALLFWGWETGSLLFAAPLALGVEGLRRFDVRFDLEPPRYNQLSDLCTVAFVVLIGAMVANRGVPHGVLAGFQYVPVAILPILLAQYASSARRIPLSALFRYMRKLKQREPSTKDPLVDLGGAYLAVTLLAAGMANQRGPTYFFAVLGFVAWALCPRRPAHASLAAWGALVVIAGVLGYGGQVGLSRLQEAIEDWVSEWQLRQSTDPSRASTDLGAIGRLKQHDAILLRVFAPQGDNTGFRLLHRASFNVMAGTSWHARNAPLAQMRGEADGATWVLAPGEPAATVRLSAKSESGRTLLPLPPGTRRIAGLVANAVRHNDYGATLAEAPEAWIRYDAQFGPGVAHYGAPAADDLALPPAERATLEQLAAELDLKGLAPAAAVRRVREYLTAFSYSTYREGAAPRGVTPLADFLTRTKSGHCEYFAAATVLLLRAAGVPARYATGFAALEYSELERAWVVRARHAHAWARAYVDGTWTDIDTTPPSWFAEEADAAALWQPLLDLFRWAAYRWSQREEGSGASDWWYALAGLLFIILAWRIVKGRRSAARAAAEAATTGSRRWQGEDSEFYALEQAIAARHGARQPGETVSAWLARVKPAPALAESARAALTLHYRYRFDPDALAGDGRATLRQAVSHAIRHAEAGAPPAPAP